MYRFVNIDRGKIAPPSANINMLKLQLVVLMTAIFTVAGLAIHWALTQNAEWYRKNMYQLQISLFGAGVVLYMCIVSFIQNIGGNVCHRLGVPAGECNESLIKGSVMTGISFTMIGTLLYLLLKWRTEMDINLNKNNLREKLMAVTGFTLPSLVYLLD